MQKVHQPKGQPSTESERHTQQLPPTPSPAMPTVIVLDVSLSMTRVFQLETANTEPQTYHSLAVHGIHQFLDFLAKTSRLEHVSLVSNITIVQDLKYAYT